MSKSRSVSFDRLLILFHPSSSSRIERFLQLTNEPLRRQPFTPSMHAVNVTTPAQYFHLLRRQMLRPYRKPLVVFSPKGILRLPAAASTLAEMSEGTSFQPVLTEKISDPSKVEKVVFLSGKMYYDLIKVRADRGLEGKITFIRTEVSSNHFNRDGKFELIQSRERFLGDLAFPLRCRHRSSQALHCGQGDPLGAGRTRKRRRLHLRPSSTPASPSERNRIGLRWTRSDGYCCTGSQELL